jgi:hypothetical protein
VALRRPRTGRDDGFDGLAALWTDGLNRSHDPGCGCGGLFAPVLQADMIEEDLTDYLLARYRQQGDTGLVRLIEQRKSEAPRRPFDLWIAGLSQVPLASADSERLEADLRVFLESLGGQGRSAIGFCT